MAIEISDTRPDDYASVFSFCGLEGGGDPSRARPFLSLTAHVDGELVGGLVCRHGDNGDSGKCVAVRGPDADHEVIGLLIGKAMQKLHARGVRYCRIAVQESAEQAAEPSGCGFWESVVWSDRPDLGSARNVYRVMGRA